MHSTPAAPGLRAGAALREISPPTPMQLCGYPHVPRVTNAVHDPLLATALFLENGPARILLCALDILMLNSDVARRMRRRVARALGMDESGVFISCTHTHSGPVTMDYLPFAGNVAMPPPDPAYLAMVEDRVEAAALAAVDRAVPAELGWVSADARGVGGNRHVPDGVTDPEVGVLGVRAGGQWIAAALIYGMHPTVLHEDSPFVSADFPYYARQHLREALGDQVTVLYHTGPSGNQSPRHHVRGQTFAEAERLGRLLGAAVVRAIPQMRFTSDPRLGGAITPVELPRRPVVPVADARALLAERRATHARLQNEGAPKASVRTAEVDVFGAEALLALAQVRESGAMDAMLARLRPFEVQAVRIGDACLAGFPGEIFSEYGLRLKSAAARKTFIVSFTNGELQGYIVTPEAVANRGYEAEGRCFEPAAGDVLVDTALRLVQGLA